LLLAVIVAHYVIIGFKVDTVPLQEVQRRLRNVGINLNAEDGRRLENRLALASRGMKRVECPSQWNQSQANCNSLASYMTVSNPLPDPKFSVENGSNDRISISDLCQVIGLTVDKNTDGRIGKCDYECIGCDSVIISFVLSALRDVNEEYHSNYGVFASGLKSKDCNCPSYASSMIMDTSDASTLSETYRR
jgi:hypothetical protein